MGNSILETLNENQRTAATTINEHVRIIAGAGSGKTRVLMARIVYLVQDCGILPNRILAITFTNKAANEMKTRLTAQLGSMASVVRISTIHSLCVRMLREDADLIGYPKTFAIMDPEDQKAILKPIYKTLEELKDSLEKKISKYEEDVKTYGETVCVCGTLTVKYGHTSEILYAGMNEDFKRLMGPYLTWYKTMEKCFELGCKTSNMGGIEGTLKGGLVDFKEIYHPRINEYIGEFDIPVNSLLYNVAFKFYKKIKERNTKHK